MDLNKFASSGLSIHIEKNGKVLFQSKDEMLKPLLEAIRKTNMAGATAYDKIVGRAAILLFSYAKVKEVFALVASTPAVESAKQLNLPLTVDTLTDNIMNRTGTDLCPMEKLSQGKAPEEFYDLMRK
jgi:hypothetical protein